MADMVTKMEQELEAELTKNLNDLTPPARASTSLSSALAAATKAESAAASVQSLRDRPAAVPAPRPLTLPEQLGQLERIERELAGRVRRELVETKNDVERKITEAHADFARRLSEETSRMERERDEIVMQARDEYHTRLGELERLLRRRSGQT